MPVPRVSDNPVAQQHYAVQWGLSKSTADAAARINFAPTSTEYLQALTALVGRNSLASISLGRDYYISARQYAGATAPFRPPVVQPWSDASTSAYLTTATADTAESGLATDLTRTAQNLVLNAGSRQIFASLDADPARLRWARVARPGACSFCLMLASRGAAYRSEDTANFRPHKGCHCDIEIASSAGAYEPPAHIRATQRLYADSTADYRGEKDKQNAFRRALAADRRSA